LFHFWLRGYGGPQRCSYRELAKLRHLARRTFAGRGNHKIFFTLIKETKIGARIFAHTLHTLTLCGCFDYQQPLSDTPTSRSLIQEATINDVPFNAWFSEENFHESPAGISFLNKVEEDPEFVGKLGCVKARV
jgi:hypothetical protein